MKPAKATALAICIAFGVGAVGASTPVAAQETTEELLEVLIGGAVGGAIGSTFGSGSGRDAATGVGAVLGVMEGLERIEANREAERRRAARLPGSETRTPHSSAFLLRPEGSNTTLRCEVVEGGGMLCKPNTAPAHPVH